MIFFDKAMKNTICIVVILMSLWARSTKNPDVSTGSLACPFVVVVIFVVVNVVVVVVVIFVVVVVVVVDIRISRH